MARRQEFEDFENKFKVSYNVSLKFSSLFERIVKISFFNMKFSNDRNASRNLQSLRNSIVTHQLEFP